MPTPTTVYKVAILIDGNDNLATILKALEGAATVCSIEVASERDAAKPARRKPRRGKDNFDTKMINEFVDHLRGGKVKSFDKKFVEDWCVKNGYSTGSYSWAIKGAKAKGAARASVSPGKEKWLDVV